MPMIIQLSIADVPIAVALPVADWGAALVARYAAFLSQTGPAWHVILGHDPTLSDTDAPWIAHEGPVTRFRVAAYRGWIDLDERRAAVETPSAERAPSALERTLAYLLMQALPREHDALLLHAAGIELDGAGHVFFGPSGAGKTTVAALAASRGQVLSDETVVLRCRSDPPELISTPFWGHSTPPALIRRADRRVPLAALYQLVQAPQFQLRPLGASEAATALLGTEKVATERVESAQAWLAVTERLVQRVPIYRLAFRPTPELWPFLAATPT